MERGLLDRQEDRDYQSFAGVQICVCAIIHKRNLQIDTCRWEVITMKEYQHLIGKIIVAVAIIVAANIIAQAIGGAGESIRSGLFQLGNALR